MATLQQLQTRLDAYLAAEQAILTGAQEYTISSGPDGNTYKRADLGKVQAMIKQLEQEIDLATARTQRCSRVRVGVPLW